MSIKINNIKIDVYNDKINSARYSIIYFNNYIEIKQEEMELIVSNLKVLVKQNKRRR